MYLKVKGLLLWQAEANSKEAQRLEEMNITTTTSSSSSSRSKRLLKSVDTGGGSLRDAYLMEE
jgi:hypothetical protein